MLLALAAMAGIVGGGSLLRAQSATFVPTPVPVVGRTSTVCTMGPATSGSSTSVAAVVIRQAPGREGTLTGSAVGADSPSLSLTEQGKGRVLSRQTGSLFLRGEGVMATASSGEVFGSAGSGLQRGLMAAPCLAPSTSHWFVGVGAEAAARSELVLTNPDEAQAEVDLQFFGPRGEVVVPGSPGIVVPAHGTRTIALDSLADVPGPLSMSVTAVDGRVAAVTRDLRSAGPVPTGADWHTSAVAPSRRVVVPGIPDGEGPRQLLVTNPGTVRAQVRVQVLSQNGAFAPVGAATLVVQPGSTAAVDLERGLAGQYGAVRLSSDRPVTGAVLSTSSRAGARTDFAVQSASPVLLRTGVVALATGGAASADAPSAAGVQSELVLSNDSDRPASVSYQVVSYDGVALRSDDVLIGGGSTSTRRLDLQAPAYLVVSVPSGSAVHGGVVYSRPDGGVAGLATVSLTSPDVASRAPDVVLDPTVGR
jgi:hypothetical protein